MRSLLETNRNKKKKNKKNKKSKSTKSKRANDIKDKNNDNRNSGNDKKHNNNKNNNKNTTTNNSNNVMNVDAPIAIPVRYVRGNVYKYQYDIIRSHLCWLDHKKLMCNREHAKVSSILTLSGWVLSL